MQACHKDMQSHVRNAGRGISSLFRQVLSLFYAPTLKHLDINEAGDLSLGTQSRFEEDAGMKNTGLGVALSYSF